MIPEAENAINLYSYQEIFPPIVKLTYELKKALKQKQA